MEFGSLVFSTSLQMPFDNTQKPCMNLLHSGSVFPVKEKKSISYLECNMLCVFA